MNKLLRIFALLMAASMLIWMAGCGDDDDDDEDTDTEAPVLQATIPAAGGTQPGNAAVTWTFSETIAEATVTGAAGTAAVQGAAVVFTPSAALPAGPVNLTCVAKDAAGNEVTAPLSFTAAAADPDPPKLEGGSCDPKDGADGVDPADYPEALVVAMNEACSEVKVSATDPEFKFTPELSADGKTLNIKFLQYSMPNETPFTITLAATDLAGNAAELTYSFTTMAKEE
jgi:hypothetical protein